MSTFAARRRGTATTGTGGGAGFAIARAIRAVAGLVALIIVAGILLVVLDANASNSIVNAVLDAARWLVGPFKGLFSLDSHKATVAVNWGLAALIYFAIGALIARLVAR